MTDVRKHTFPNPLLPRTQVTAAELSHPGRLGESVLAMDINGDWQLDAVCTIKWPGPAATDRTTRVSCVSLTQSAARWNVDVFKRALERGPFIMRNTAEHRTYKLDPSLAVDAPLLSAARENLGALRSFPQHPQLPGGPSFVRPELPAQPVYPGNLRPVHPTPPRNGMPAHPKF